MTYTFNGCSASDTAVVINDLLKPDAGTNVSICEPTTVYGLKAAPVGTTWSVATGNPSLAIINASTGAVTGISNVGTYKFILTDVSSSCKDTVEIVKKALPTVSADGGLLTCGNQNGGIIPQSRVSPAGGTYSWAGPGVVSGGTTDRPTLNKPGIYTLTYTYNGCSASDTAVVRNDLLKPDAGTNVSICEPTTVYGLKAAPVGTTWSVATGNPSAAIINATTGAVTGISNVGTYKFILTDISSSCRDTVEIVKKVLPTVRANGGILTCGVDGITPQIIVLPTGGTYSWAGPGIVSGGTTDRPTLNKPGIYTLTYTYNGCSASDTALVINDLLKPDAGANVSICEPAATYTLRAAPVGTTWSVATGNPSAAIINASTGAVTGITNVGTYKFILTDVSSLCKDTVEIVKKALPTVRADGGLLPCGNQAVGITVQSSVSPAGGTYLWAGPGVLSGGTTGTPRLNIAGTYTLTYTYNGCSASDTALVRNEGIPSIVIITEDNNLCGSGSLTLFVRGCETISGYTAKWFTDALGTIPAPGLNTGNNYITPVLDATTTYYVACVSNSTPSCKSKAAGIVARILPKPIAEGITTPVTCNGSTTNSDGKIILTRFTPGDKYAYNTGTTYTGIQDFNSASLIPSDGVLVNNLTNPVTPQTYTIRVFNAAGCYTDVVVNYDVFIRCDQPCIQPTAVTAGSNSPIALGGTINLTSSSTGGTNYSWRGPNGFSSNLQNPNITNSTTAMAGTYTVTVTSSGTGTCTATATTYVILVSSTCNVPTAVTAGSNSPITQGGMIHLTSSSLGGTAYSWRGPNGFTSGLQNPSIANATNAMIGTYTVTVTSSGTCTAMATTVIVGVFPPTCTSPTAVTASSNSPIAQGGTINFTSSSTSGTGYLWRGPNGFSSSLQNPSINNATSAMAGTYTVTITGTGTCTATATTLVVITPTCTPPIVEGKTTPVTCNGSTTNSDGKIILTRFTLGDKYAYSTGTSYTGNQDFSSASVIPANGVLVSNLPNPVSVLTYTIRVFNAPNCYTDLVVNYNVVVDCPTPCIPPVVEGKTTPVTCNGSTTNSDGKIILSA